MPIDQSCFRWGVPLCCGLLLIGVFGTARICAGAEQPNPARYVDPTWPSPVEPIAATDDPACCDQCPSACNVCWCKRRGRVWTQVDYLLWWVEGQQVPALVTTAPVGESGSLDNPNTEILFGGGRIDADVRSGFRIRGGYWFDCCETWGIMYDFFTLGQTGSEFSGVSTSTQPLWRPLNNTDPAVGGPDAQLLDEVQVGTTSKIYSPGVYCRKNLCCCYQAACCEDRSGCCYDDRSGYRIDAIVGYRNFRVAETLSMGETASVPPATFELNDYFETDNRFHGVDFGIIAEVDRCKWSFEWLARVALGVNYQTVIVDGSATQDIPPLSRTGGLLAQTSNIGVTKDDEFAVIPEFGLNVMYQIRPRTRLRLGYNFIYLSNVVRPGDQIDPNVDGRFLDPNLVPPFTPPATSPAPRFANNSMWLQGLNFGVDVRF